MSIPLTALGGSQGALDDCHNEDFHLENFLHLSRRVDLELSQLKS